jgi:ribosome-binding protein aMBF1 (putative translation factor)
MNIEKFEQRTIELTEALLVARKKRGNMIKAVASTHGLSRNKLAEETELNPNTVTRIFKGETHTKDEAVAKVLAVIEQAGGNIGELV